MHGILLGRWNHWRHILRAGRVSHSPAQPTEVQYTRVSLSVMSEMGLDAVPDFPIGSIGWSLGPQSLGAKVYNISNTLIGLSHLCCHNVLYFQNNPSVIFLTQLHSISEYCRILNTPHHLRLYWNWLNTLPHLHFI